MKFRVIAKNADGIEEKRVLEASSRLAVYEALQKEGLTVVSLTEGGGFALPAWTQMTIGSGVKTEERITFTKNLAAMISAGLPLSRALSVIERQSTNKILKRITADLASRVEKGSSFHEALAAHPKVFSTLFVAMTKAGEESGTLADSLAVVARQMEKAHTLAKKVRGAMIYPSIILAAVVIIGILMLIYVVPTLSNTFKELGVELPAATRAIVSASDAFAAHAALAFSGLLLFVLGMVLFVRSKPGSRIVLAISLRLPVIGELVRETMSARMARALSSLLSSGVEMLSALSITGEVVGKNRFGTVVMEAEERVRKGDALSAPFAEHTTLYPIFVSEMIAVGEETGKVASMLSQVAEYYETDVEDRTKDLSTIIEPVLMLLIGAVVGVFAISMISPIYSLSDKI